MRKIFFILLIGLWSLLPGTASSAAGIIDLTLARQYYAELKKACDADGGKLWGVQLYGPTMIVDPQTFELVANQADRNKKLTEDNGVFIGKIDPEVGMANTAIDWSGTHWTMVRWDALSNTGPIERTMLLIHESWHRIQNELGIQETVTSNVHLDENEGRLLILLEFRALGRAIQATNSRERADAISDALTLRKYRQSQFPANNENAFERSEGIAEYTGMKLCGAPDSLLGKVVVRKLRSGESIEGLANSFAYYTGPAIGLLLDRFGGDWREKVKNGADLPGLLAAAINWHTPEGEAQQKIAFNAIGGKYDVEALRTVILTQNSGQLAKDIQNRIDKYGKLIIPNNNLQLTFNPQERLVPYDTIGVIYKTIKLSGDFGVLDVTNGIIRENNWTYFMLAAPEKLEGNPIMGEGYTLKLNPGWQVVSKAKGVYLIRKY